MSTIIDVQNLFTAIHGTPIHQDINFSVSRGEVFAIVGSSGCGKSTLLRALLRLLKPTSGTIQIFGQNIWHSRSAVFQTVLRRWGVMFQGGALFSALTLLENVCFPIQRFTTLPSDIMESLALIKIMMSGLEEDAALKYPSELSGGMQKRGALARALALDPELLFLDEPGSGLDPQSADELDTLILNLKKTLGLTIVMVTHDLASLWRVADRVVFLGEGRVLGIGSVQEVSQLSHPLIRAYFDSARGQRGH